MWYDDTTLIQYLMSNLFGHSSEMEEAAKIYIKPFNQFVVYFRNSIRVGILSSLIEGHIIMVLYDLVLCIRLE